MNEIKISAIMPVYNVEKYIGKCIDCLLYTSQVNAGATLTITGNGTIDASSASDYVVPVNCNGGNLVIENGTITCLLYTSRCV